MKLSTGTNSFQTRFGPWALVAGASQGLGAEYARQLAARGLNLVLVARHSGRLDALAADLAAQYPVQTRTIVCDLSQAEAAEQVATQAAGLEVGLLVYNAALAPVAPFFELTLEQHLAALQTNVRTPLELVYRFGEHMRARRRGGILLMSSLSALQGSALIAHYAATKAYNLILAEGLWDELRQDGIAVLASLPASIATPNYQASLPEQGRSGVPAMPPQQVAAESLAALGRQSTRIPGWSNRAAAFVMRRLLPRQAAIRLMGSTLRRMNSH
ncbi:MAG: SDR family NAD(P)-dependent oxidoreductase [Anaerolineaceae bacterium]|nr:SDR family NAD(P)-dependent oxidoreductase [Anaerolineaceae bacterium]